MWMRMGRHHVERAERNDRIAQRAVVVDGERAEHRRIELGARSRDPGLAAVGGKGLDYRGSPAAAANACSVAADAKRPGSMRDGDGGRRAAPSSPACPFP